MGTCGVAVVCQGRTRTALYFEHLFPSTPYLVHLNSEFVLPVTPVCFAMPVRASTTLSCLAIEADRDRLPAAAGAVPLLVVVHLVLVGLLSVQSK